MKTVLIAYALIFIAILIIADIDNKRIASLERRVAEIENLLGIVRKP